MRERTYCQVLDQQLPANNVIRFSDDFGGETNLYQGLDVNLDARLPKGAFLRAGLGATGRTFDNCNLEKAGYEAVAVLATASGTETYADGTSYCHREYPFRPDFRASGSCTLSYDILLSGTYQFSRGVQTGGAGPSILASWTISQAAFTPGGVQNGPPISSTLGRAPNTSTPSKTVQLMRKGLEYGDHNLNQLDMRLAKRVRFGRYSLTGSFDLYDVFNSSWPFTVTNTFSTAPTAIWQKPTNVLQSRFFKLGAGLNF